MSDLASQSNNDVMPKHEKEMEQRGSRIKVVIPTAVQQTGYSSRDPHTTFRKDQGQPEVLVKRRPTKRKQESAKKAARHKGCVGGQRQAQGHEKQNMRRNWSG